MAKRSKALFIYDGPADGKLFSEWHADVNLVETVDQAERCADKNYSVFVYISLNRKNIEAINDHIKGVRRKRFAGIYIRHGASEDITKWNRGKQGSLFPVWEIKSISLLSNAMKEVELHFAHTLFSTQKTDILTASDFHPGSLAGRIEKVADTIVELRLNSTSDIVAELRRISTLLKQGGVSDLMPDHIRQESAKQTIVSVLTQISLIFDVVHSQKLAGIIVSGAVAALVGGLGWPGAMCFGLSLASWNGKDAFMAAVAKLPTSRNFKRLKSFEE